MQKNATRLVNAGGMESLHVKEFGTDLRLERLTFFSGGGEKGRWGDWELNNQVHYKRTVHQH